MTQRKSGRSIAIFVDNLDATGVVVNAIAIAGALQARGWSVDIIAANASGTLTAAIPRGVRVSGLVAYGSAEVSRKSRMRRALLAYRRALRRCRPNVLFSVGNQGHLASVAASFGLRIKLVVRISNELERERSDISGARRYFRFARFRLIALRSERLVFVSRHLFESFGSVGVRLRAKAVVIPNGVDVRSVRERARETCDHPWFSQTASSPVVLAIGRLVEQKNFVTLLRAVAYARQKLPLRLVIIGAGPMFDVLMEEANSLGLADAFEIIPPVPNPMPYLANCSVFAMPSSWEGSSNVLLEALACGTPVVASRTAGNAEEVLDYGRCGLIVDHADAEGMGEALLIQCSERRISPGERAEDFSRAASLQTYTDLFDELTFEAPA